MFDVLLATVCNLRKSIPECLANRNSLIIRKLRRLPVFGVSKVRFRNGNQRSINGHPEESSEGRGRLANRGWRVAADDSLLANRRIEVKGRRSIAYDVPHLLTVE